MIQIKNFWEGECLLYVFFVYWSLIGCSRMCNTLLWQINYPYQTMWPEVLRLLKENSILNEFWVKRIVPHEVSSKDLLLNCYPDMRVTNRGLSRPNRSITHWWTRVNRSVRTEYREKDMSVEKVNMFTRSNLLFQIPMGSVCRTKSLPSPVLYLVKS